GWVVRELRHRAESRRRDGRAESELEFFFEQSPEGIWRFDLVRPLALTVPESEQIEHLYRHARIAACNPAMARMQGFERPRDLLDLTLSDLMPPDSPRGRHLMAFLRSGFRLAEAEAQESDPDGNPRFFLHTLLGKIENGRLLYLWGTQTDVTEGRLLEKELRQGMAELLAADRHKDEFLAILAHELRNPLAPIRNAVEIMKRTAPPDPGLTRAREMINRQVHQLSRLVDDLLDVSRIRRGAIELRREWIELSAVVEGAVQASRPLIERRGHDLFIQGPHAPVFMEADPVRLEQVVANLLDNAAKYTPLGGRIWLMIEHQEEVVSITVRDTGIGFRPGGEHQLFEPFVQGALPADAKGGLGIGLALVHGLVKLHGGEVAARSAGEGKGSEFVVRLRGAQREPVPATRSAAEVAEPAPARPLSVLIVDDDDDAAASLATLAALWGHRPRTAADGETGLAAAATPEEPPDAAVLDLALPGMSGWELAQELRRQWGADLLLVALTGHGQEEDRKRTQAAGFDHHFVKPIAPETLRHLLADWSKRH
ncbi:MAG TPA: hybrid sensor histidine kinase/response regulator, partial [Thermoanaerobaculia bacterium]|nr:hybrid sensor histidine kinase/response regulator [Thermoanaerobaculia bacterium]